MRYSSWVFVLLLALALVSSFGCETKNTNQTTDGDVDADGDVVSDGDVLPDGDSDVDGDVDADSEPDSEIEKTEMEPDEDKEIDLVDGDLDDIDTLTENDVDLDLTETDTDGESDGESLEPDSEFEYACEIREGVDASALVEIWDTYNGVGCVECTNDEKYRWGDVTLIIAPDYSFTFSHTERCTVRQSGSDTTEERTIEPFLASGSLTVEQRAWVDELLTLDRNQIPCSDVSSVEDNSGHINLYLNNPSGYLMAAVDYPEWFTKDSGEEQWRMLDATWKLFDSVKDMIGYTFTSCLDDY